MKLCKDCKHYAFPAFPVCRRDRNKELDPVDGFFGGPEYDCYAERETPAFRNGWFGCKIDTGACGPKARFFEPKEK